MQDVLESGIRGTRVLGRAEAIEGVACRPTFRHWHPFNRAEYLEAMTLLPGYLLSSQGDRMLMASSVEGRFPLPRPPPDWLCERFASDVKMRVLREKHLLRGSHATACYRRPYCAVTSNPTGRRTRRPFSAATCPDYVNELTSPEALKRYGYFDPPRWAG